MALIPGVPPLLNRVGNIGNRVILLVADAALVLGLFSRSVPQWGIYKDKKLAIKPDSIVSLEAKYGWRVSDYPLEKGAFESYNKVREPYEVRLRMTKGGTDSARALFLQTIFDMAASINVYDVYMPEGALVHLTLANYEFRRTSTSGVTLLSVDAHFVEVMENVTPTFTNTATDSAQSPQQGGTVQTQDPTPAERITAGTAPI